MKYQRNNQSTRDDLRDYISKAHFPAIAVQCAPTVEKEFPSLLSERLMKERVETCYVNEASKDAGPILYCRGPRETAARIQGAVRDRVWFQDRVIAVDFVGDRLYAEVSVNLRRHDDSFSHLTGELATQSGSIQWLRAIESRAFESVIMVCVAPAKGMLSWLRQIRDGAIPHAGGILSRVSQRPIAYWNSILAETIRISGHLSRTGILHSFRELLRDGHFPSGISLSSHGGQDLMCLPSGEEGPNPFLIDFEVILPDGTNMDEVMAVLREWGARNKIAVDRIARNEWRPVPDTRTLAG